MAPRVKKSMKNVTSRGGVGSARDAKEGKEQAGRRGEPSKARFRRTDRTRKEKKYKYKLKLKGWLQTPQDWARFDAWAKVNALPKQYPEPEPIVRPVKPLYLLKKRIKVLAEPKEIPDPRCLCKPIESQISKAALRARPSRRTILLALPNIKLCDFGRIFYRVSPAALTYEASERILELSKPRMLLPEKCKPPRLSMCEKKGLDEERLRQLALAKKLVDCPEQLTPEEIAEIFTPLGIKRTALTYKITPWVSYLALPMYKKLKPRKDKKAKQWKKEIIEGREKRGKKAFAEFKKKQEKEKSKKRKKCENGKPEKGKSEKGKSEKRKSKKRKAEKTPEGGDTADEDEEKEQKKEGKDEEEEKSEEEKEKEKKRKKAKNAWRYAKDPCKEDPHGVKKGALKGEASSRTKELATPRERKDKACKAKPFTVKKGALSASASGRVSELAKPKNPREPVEKREPREKDKYGRPIFEMPVYGKVLPKPPPYPKAECPSKEEKKKVKKRRPIDPIVYEPTYDPCEHPYWAKRQKAERKRAEKLLPKRKRRRKPRKKRPNVYKEQAEEEAEADKGEDTVTETETEAETATAAEAETEAETATVAEPEPEAEAEAEAEADNAE